MLVRKYDGTMVEINKCEYANDHQYYKKLGEIMYNIEVTEEEKPKGYSRQAIDNLLKIYVRNN
jgi:flagellum-specific peptidoglycan hydrolase FlgJ